MPLPKLDYSKVQSILVTPVGDYVGTEVDYKSGQHRHYDLLMTDLPNLVTACQEAHLTLNGLCDDCGQVFPTTSHRYGDTPLALCDACLTRLSPQPAEPQPPEGATWCEWCGERPARPHEPCDVCPKLDAQPAQPASPSIALSEILGLTSEQAQHLQGVDRLNFWRAGSLQCQANHGSRGVKLPCPQAVISDVDLTQFFRSWGWEQVSTPKLYFRPTASSLVRL